MRLWVDDERPPPDETWTWAKTADEAYKLWSVGPVRVLSLDHDLGEGGDTRTLARAICELAFAGQLEPPRWYVHSANPVGVEYLTGVLEQADRAWRRFITQENLRASYRRKDREAIA